MPGKPEALKNLEAVEVQKEMKVQEHIQTPTTTKNPEVTVVKTIMILNVKEIVEVLAQMVAVIFR